MIGSRSTLTDETPSDVKTEPYAHRLVIIAVLGAVVTMLISTLYPSGRPADDQMSLSFTATYLWIGAQSFALTLPGLLIGILIGKIAPRVGALLGAGLILAVPVIVLCDVMTFNWIAARFLSSTMSRIVTSLLPALSLHVTPAAVVQGIGIVLVVLFAAWAIWKAAGAVGVRWRNREESVQPLATSVVLSLAALLTSYSAISTLGRTTAEMARSSSRHPFCAFHIVGFRGVGVPVPTARAAVIARLRGLQAIDSVHRREQQQLDVAVRGATTATESNVARGKRVIVVVVECLRPEVIDPSIMPNLHAFAQKSILCDANFAAGNATCHSMFSLVTGLEAVWFRRPVTENPPFNRLLHEAGFELAFYGGQTDWADYNMEGFISPTVYESFEIEEPQVPDTDLRAVERTLEFISYPDDEDRDEPATRSKTTPRAAICYLYATHSRFRYSAPEDRVFLPESLESVIMSRDPTLRDHVYNGYKNSLRTMDRMIAPLLREDCVVMVMGDHGEPFLDDGTAIHGTRLSRFQNMTPAIVYYPGVEPRRIDQPTFHADLLPTLLSILDVSTDAETVFDGVDLTTADDSLLSQRRFMTRNFMDSTSMLVGPWSNDPTKPFGYRVSYDIWNWQSSYLNPIDEQGFEWEADDGIGESEKGKREFLDWIIGRFGEPASDETLSSRELFEKFFRAEDTETRSAALEIAASVPDPEEYLYDLITESTRDPVPEIRNKAKDLVIRISRYRGRTEPEAP